MHVPKSETLSNITIIDRCVNKLQTSPALSFQSESLRPRCMYAKSECFAIFVVRQAARSTRFQLNDGVLRLEMRWAQVFMVVFNCIWV